MRYVYSFKKHLRGVDGLFVLLGLLAIPFIFLVMYISLVATFYIDGTNEHINIHAFDIIFLPIVIIPSLLLLIPLFKKIYNAKKLLDDNSEVDAVIERYQNIRRYQGGTRAAINVFFSYTVDNTVYKSTVGIPNNKYASGYIYSYAQVGEKVQILVDNKNPKNIMLKEVFMEDPIPINASDVQVSGDTKKCPRCGKEISQNAVICRFCGTEPATYERQRKNFERFVKNIERFVNLLPKKKEPKE